MQGFGTLGTPTPTGARGAPSPIRSCAAPDGRLDVLVIEDHAPTRALLSEILREEGYAEASASDGAAGLVLAERARPRLILLDLWMPIMDGWQFASHYQAAPGPHAALVLLSGRPELPEAAEQLGAHAFLAKPFDMDVLLSVVARAVRAAPIDLGHADGRRHALAGLGHPLPA